MGYVRQSKILKLKFADPEMEGLEVRARTLPLGQFMELMKLAAFGEGKFTQQDAEHIDSIFRGFSSALVSWNLESPDPRGDEYPPLPVSTDMDGLYSQDFDFIMDIIKAWMNAIAAITDDLGKGSNSGGQSLAASLPMEPLSPSPSN